MNILEFSRHSVSHWILRHCGLYSISVYKLDLGLLLNAHISSCCASRTRLPATVYVLAQRVIPK